MNDEQPTARPVARPILDRSVVDEFIKVMRADSDGRLFADFLADAERRLDALRGLTCEDRPAIQFEAHTLLGSSGTFGMMRLSQLARALERSAATIRAEDYPAAVERLIEVFRVSRRELVDYLKETSAQAASEN